MDDLDEEGTLTWSNGILLANGGYTDWEDDANQDGRDCVWWGELGMKIEACTVKYGYICEYGK